MMMSISLISLQLPCEPVQGKGTELYLEPVKIQMSLDIFLDRKSLQCSHKRSMGLSTQYLGTQQLLVRLGDCALSARGILSYINLAIYQVF